MFEFMRGKIVEAAAKEVILEVNGIGYKLFSPSNQASQLPLPGAEALFYVSFVIREFAHTLYGFSTRSERDLFELLLTISGVGPKMAIAIIGSMSSHELRSAIQQGNTLVLCKVPGIGKKTAERLVMELRDKLAAWEGPLDVESIQGGFSGTSGHLVRDATNALINLGYNQSTAQMAIKKALDHLSGEPELSALITFALRQK